MWWLFSAALFEHDLWRQLWKEFLLPFTALRRVASLLVWHEDYVCLHTEQFVYHLPPVKNQPSGQLWETKGKTVCTHSTPSSSALICLQRGGEAGTVTSGLQLCPRHQAQITLSSLPAPLRSVFLFSTPFEWSWFSAQIQTRPLFLGEEVQARITHGSEKGTQFKLWDKKTERDL